MGFIGGLLLLPIAAPVMGFRFLLESLREEADAVLRDEGRAFAELIDLSMRHTAGQLSDIEFAQQEAELLERLSSMRDYREELLQSELDVDEDGWIAADPDSDEDTSLDGDQDADEEQLPDAESDDDGDGDAFDAESDMDEEEW